MRLGRFGEHEVLEKKIHAPSPCYTYHRSTSLQNQWPEAKPVPLPLKIILVSVLAYGIFSYIAAPELPKHTTVEQRTVSPYMPEVYK